MCILDFYDLHAFTNSGAQRGMVASGMSFYDSVLSRLRAWLGRERERERVSAPHKRF